MRIEVLTADDLDRRWQRPGSVDGNRYLASLVRSGPQSYVENANVRIEVVAIDDKVVPLIFSENAEGNSNVCSAYSHYLEYPFHELTKRYPGIPLSLLDPPKSLISAIFRRGSIDNIVFVNNWLLSTNPGHRLSPSEVAELTLYLTRRFPESALVFRSINPLSDRPGYDALRANGYRLVPSRKVYMLDTGSTGYLKRSNIRQDLRELRQTSYSIVGHSGSLVSLVPRITELYRSLYLDKHSTLNPQFNADFFVQTLKDDFFKYRALIKDGRLDAFVTYFERDGAITSSLIGYDLYAPQKLGLYRMAFAIIISEAAQRKALLNLSAGVGDFKLLRGAVAVQESDAIFDRHLPARRRWLWAGVAMAGGFGSLLAPR